MDNINYREAKTIDEKIAILKSHQLFVYLMLSSLSVDIPREERLEFYNKHNIDLDFMARSLKAGISVQQLESAGFSKDAAFETVAGTVLNITDK